MQNKGMLSVPRLPLNLSMAICLLLITAAIASVIATPKSRTLTNPPILENVVPRQLGAWEDMPSPYAQVSVNTWAKSITDIFYDQVLMRTYQDKSGNQIMLALAYAAVQHQDVKVHQPEVCYPAQGYEILAMQNHVFNIPGYQYPINGKQIIFKNNDRIEAVSYWIRLGNSFPTSGLEMRFQMLEDGLAGYLDDGLLVRVSTLINQASDAPAAYEVQKQFLTALVNTVDVSAPKLLVPMVAK